MNKQSNAWVWRTYQQIWSCWRGVLTATAIGTLAGQASASLTPQLVTSRDVLTLIGAIIGAVVGIQFGLLAWRRSPDYQVSIGDKFLGKSEWSNAIEAFSEAMRIQGTRPA